MRQSILPASVVSSCTTRSPRTSIEVIDRVPFLGCFVDEDAEDAFLHYVSQGWLNHILVAVVIGICAIINSSFKTLLDAATEVQRATAGAFFVVAAMFLALRHLSKRALQGHDGIPSSQRAARARRHESIGKQESLTNDGLGVLLLDTPEPRRLARIGEHLSVVLQMTSPLAAAGFAWSRSRCASASPEELLQCTNTFSYEAYPLIMNTLYVTFHISRWFTAASAHVLTVVSYVLASFAVAYKTNSSNQRLYATIFPYVIHSMYCVAYASSKEEAMRRTFILIVEAERHAEELRRAVRLTTLAASRTVPSHVFRFGARGALKASSSVTAIVASGLTCFSLWAQQSGPCDIVEAILGHSTLFEEACVRPMMQQRARFGGPECSVTRINSGGDVLLYAVSISEGPGWSNTRHREWLRQILSNGLEHMRRRTDAASNVNSSGSNPASRGSAFEEEQVSSPNSPSRNSPQQQRSMWHNSKDMLLPIGCLAFGVVKIHHLTTTCSVVATGAVVERCCTMLRDACDRAAPAIVLREQDRILNVRSTVSVALPALLIACDDSVNLSGQNRMTPLPAMLSHQRPVPESSADEAAACLTVVGPSVSSNERTTVDEAARGASSSASTSKNNTVNTFETVNLHPERLCGDGLALTMMHRMECEGEGTAQDATVADSEGLSCHASSRTTGCSRLLRAFENPGAEANFRLEAQLHDEGVMRSSLWLFALAVGHIWTCLVYALHSWEALSPLPYAVAGCILTGAFVCAAYLGLRHESRWAVRLNCICRAEFVLNAASIVDVYPWVASLLYILAPLVTMSQDNALGTSMAGWIFLAISRPMTRPHTKAPVAHALHVILLAVLGTIKTLIISNGSYSTAVDASIYAIPAVLAARLFVDRIAADRFEIYMHVEQQKKDLVEWMQRARHVLMSMVPTEEAQTLLLQRCYERDEMEQLRRFRDERAVVRGGFSGVHDSPEVEPTTRNHQRIQPLVTDGLISVVSDAGDSRRRTGYVAELEISMDEAPRRAATRLNPFQSTVIATRVLERAVVMLQVGCLAQPIAPMGSHPIPGAIIVVGSPNTTSGSREGSLALAGSSGNSFDGPHQSRTAVLNSIAAHHLPCGSCVAPQTLAEWDVVVDAIRRGLSVAKDKRESPQEMPHCKRVETPARDALWYASNASVLEKHLIEISHISVVLTKQIGDTFIIAAGDRKQQHARSTIVTAALNALLAITSEFQKISFSSVGDTSGGSATSMNIPPAVANLTRGSQQWRRSDNRDGFPSPPGAFLTRSACSLTWRACVVWSPTVGALVGDYGPTFEWYGPEVELARCLMSRKPDEGGCLEWNTALVSWTAAAGIHSNTPSEGSTDLVLQGSLSDGFPLRCSGVDGPRYFHHFRAANP